MATITLTIPDAQVNRVINALCGSPLNQVPLTPTAANAKATVVAWVSEQVKLFETRAVVIDTTGLVT